MSTSSRSPSLSAIIIRYCQPPLSTIIDQLSNNWLANKSTTLTSNASGQGNLEPAFDGKMSDFSLYVKNPGVRTRLKLKGYDSSTARGGCQSRHHQSQPKGSRSCCEIAGLHDVFRILWQVPCTNFADQLIPMRFRSFTMTIGQLPRQRLKTFWSSFFPTAKPIKNDRTHCWKAKLRICRTETPVFLWPPCMEIARNWKDSAQSQPTPSTTKPR